jgi:hypothetical protein
VLAVAIGACLLLAALGLTVSRPGEHRLSFSNAPPAALPTVPTTMAAAPSSTAAPAPSSTVAPTTTRPPVTRAAPARRPAVIQAAPGVTLNLPPAPVAPTSGGPAPAAGPAGDSISQSPAPSPSTTVTTSAGTTSTSYAYLDSWAPNKPTRWNPCQTIHYAVNATEAPAGSLATVQQAVARMADATGVTWVFDGATDEVPTSQWGYGPSTSFPNGWQPLLIGFAHDAESDLLEGGNAGTGYPVTVEFTATGERVDVSGTVAIDVDQMDGLPLGFGGVSVGSVVLHELGHAVGLAHVQDEAQIMNPIVGPWTPSQWGPGDTEGLRRIGIDAGCARTAPPPPWG